MSLVVLGKETNTITCLGIFQNRCAISLLLLDFSQTTMTHFRDKYRSFCLLYILCIFGFVVQYFILTLNSKKTHFRIFLYCNVSIFPLLESGDENAL